MKRAAVHRVCLSILLCGVLAWNACSTTWIGEAEQIVNVLIPATTNVVTLIATLQGTVTAADLQTAQSVGAEVSADLQLLQSLIGQYRKADSASQAGLLSQIQAAVQATESKLNELLPALHVKDPATQAKVTALVGIVLSEVQSIAEIVPAVSGNEASVTLRKATFATKKIPLSASEFVSSYNATMTEKTGYPQLDHATSGLRIHAHGKIARWASAGLLK